MVLNKYKLKEPIEAIQFDGTYKQFQELFKINPSGIVLIKSDDPNDIWIKVQTLNGDRIIVEKEDYLFLTEFLSFEFDKIWKTMSKKEFEFLYEKV